MSPLLLNFSPLRTGWILLYSTRASQHNNVSIKCWTEKRLRVMAEREWCCSYSLNRNYSSISFPAELSSSQKKLLWPNLYYNNSTHQWSVKWEVMLGIDSAAYTEIEITNEPTGLLMLANRYNGYHCTPIIQWFFLMFPITVFHML